MVDNAEWLDKLEYIPFLREVGRHFSVNRMLTMDSVKLRLDREQPLSFLEFNYSIMQAYDFVELYKRYGCRLQSAAPTSGAMSFRASIWAAAWTMPQLFGLTTPLITTRPAPRWARPRRARCGSTPNAVSPMTIGSSGATPRMAMSAASCACSPTALDEIAAGKARRRRDERRQEILATEATRLCHGDAAARCGRDTAARAFAGDAAEDCQLSF